MAVAQNVARLTEAEYLQLDREAEVKSEFFDGEMFAMAGGTHAHSLIAANLIRRLGNRLDGKGCVVYTADLRVKVEATGLLTYPDVSVVCGTQRFLDEKEDTLLNPTLVIEVISESTEAYDRGKKFEHFRQITSCSEILLVSQREPRIDQYVRQQADWRLKEAVGMQAELELPSVGIVLPLAEVFANVEFLPSSLRTKK